MLLDLIEYLTEPHPNLEYLTELHPTSSQVLVAQWLRRAPALQRQFLPDPFLQFQEVKCVDLADSGGNCAKSPQKYQPKPFASHILKLHQFDGFKPKWFHPGVHC